MIQLKTIRDGVANAVAATTDYINSTVTSCGRKFEALTEAVLPVTAAKIVQKVVYGAVFTAAIRYAPANYVLGAALGLGALEVVNYLANTGRTFLGASFYQNAARGSAVALVIYAVEEIAKIVLQQKANIVGVAVGAAAELATAAGLIWLAQRPVEPVVVQTSTVTTADNTTAVAAQ